MGCPCSRGLLPCPASTSGATQGASGTPISQTGKRRFTKSSTAGKEQSWASSLSGPDSKACPLTWLMLWLERMGLTAPIRWELEDTEGVRGGMRPAWAVAEAGAPVGWSDTNPCHRLTPLTPPGLRQGTALPGCPEHGSSTRPCARASPRAFPDHPVLMLGLSTCVGPLGTAVCWGAPTLTWLPIPQP